MARRSYKTPTEDAAIASADKGERIDRLALEARHAYAQRVAAQIRANRKVA